MPKKKTKQTEKKKPQQGVVAEAWENMNEDLAKVLPTFILNRLQGGKNKLWVVLAVAVVELIVLGVVIKLVYDWFVS